MLSGNILINATGVVLLLIGLTTAHAADHKELLTPGAGNHHEAIQTLMDREGKNYPVIHRETIRIHPDNITDPLVWQAERGKFLQETRSIALQMHAEAQETIAAVGLKHYKKKIADKDKTHKTFGTDYRAEITFIQGELCVRMVHLPSGISLYYLKDSEIPADSRSLEVVIARQHIKANRHDKLGESKGRDTAIIRIEDWTADAKVVSDQFYPRAFPYTPAWWRDFYDANINWKLSGWRSAFGAVCGTLQAGVTCGAMSARMLIQNMAGVPVEAFNKGPIVGSMLFAMAISTFNPSYRNIMNDSGTQEDKNIKSALQNMFFSYSVIFFDPARGGFAIFDFTNPDNLMLAAYFGITATIHGVGRRAYYLFTEIRTAERASSDSITFKWRGEEVDTEISWSSIEQQGIYFVPFFLKMLGYYPTGVAEVYLPYMDKPILDIGTWTLLASVPIVQSLAVAYSYSKGYKRAGSLDGVAGSDTFFQRLKKIPVSVGKHIMRLGEWGVMAQQTCYYAIAQLAGHDPNIHRLPLERTTEIE